MSQFSQEQQQLPRHEQGIHSLELRAGIERLRKKLGNKEQQRSRLSEEHSSATNPKEAGSLQRTPTPIALDKLSLEESPRKKDRKPLSTRVTSNSPEKLSGNEQARWNEVAGDNGSGHTRHMRINSLPRESRRDDTPRRASSSPDASIWALGSPKLSKNRSGNLSDSKVVESWTDEQQDVPNRIVSDDTFEQFF